MPLGICRCLRARTRVHNVIVHQGRAVDSETGTEEEIEPDEDDDDEEDFEFSPLAALRTKPVTRQSMKGVSKQIVKSR